MDEVVIEIEGVVMKMVRRSTLKAPAEVSAIIPRVEIRRKTYENGQLTAEHEMILNSITIVHAPRQPLAGESPPEFEGDAENSIKNQPVRSKIQVNPTMAAGVKTEPTGKVMAIEKTA